MNTIALNALTSEALSLASSLEEWMLEYCDEAGRDDLCDARTAPAMVNLADGIMAIVDQLIAAYADGNLVDIRTVRIAESIVKNVLAWIFPA